MKNLIIADKEFTSRLFLGTGKFGSYTLMQEAIKASGSELVTMALKRLDPNSKEENLWSALQLPGSIYCPIPQALEMRKRLFWLRN